MRRVMLRFAILVNGLASGIWLSDAHNGFRALTSEVARMIHLYENGFTHCSEIIIQVRRLRLRYVERPTTINYSSYSRAKGQSMWNALNIIIDLLLRRVLR